PSRSKITEARRISDPLIPAGLSLYFPVFLTTLRRFRLTESVMAFDFKPGTALRVTINKEISRAAARKTLERLFMTDRAIYGPIDTREKNFKARPKRRGGRVWTKYPNKVHPKLDRGVAATIKATPQALKDLASVEDFVEVAAQ